MTTQHCDLAVIGGGIAGLAIAELFSRSGHGTVLFEKNDLLCQESSAQQHGWFHFGSLYSIFPQNQFLRTMLGGVEDIRDYYGGFPGMNIRAGTTGKLQFDPSPDSWFRDEPIEYIVAARNDPDFALRQFGGVRSYAAKLFFLATWELAIKQFISRHQRFERHDWRPNRGAADWIARAGIRDYSREVISKPALGDIALDPDTHFRIVGYDRPMRAMTIARDLALSLVASGGDIRTGTEVVSLEAEGSRHRLLTSDGKSFLASQVVVASGKWMARFMEKDSDLKVVASPMLVAYPAVADRHFVRMTPFVHRTINHLHHEVDGQRYSLIGGGHAAAPGDAAACERVQKELVTMAAQVFPRLAGCKVCQTYLGYKAEITAKSSERSYQYIMRLLRPGLHAVVPGKFSLSFSLAVNLYHKITGRKPEAAVPAVPRGSAPVGLTLHAAMIKAALADKRPVGDAA